jgi:hypothetical protein
MQPHPTPLRLPLGPIAATAFALCLLAITEPARALPEGERIEVRGIVTDASGRPLSGLDVTLVASREKLDLRRLARQSEASVRRTTRTNDRGEYQLDWNWSRYYNRFTLEVGLTVRVPGGETVRTLYTQDVTNRLRHPPVVVSLLLADTTFIERYRSFVASLATSGERRVFEAMGAPDHIEIKQYPTHRETNWLYYAAGRSFLFRNGDFQREVAFTPVERAPSSP